MESIHVPASVLHRLLAVVRWLAPIALSAIVTFAGFGYRWFESRASRDDVATKVAKAVGAAAAAQSAAHHGTSLAEDHAKELAALWMHVIAVEAELKVYRDHGKADAAKRGQLIEEAKSFYALEHELQLRTHANDPALAARLTLMTKWRPDP